MYAWDFFESQDSSKRPTQVLEHVQLPWGGGGEISITEETWIRTLDLSIPSP